MFIIKTIENPEFKNCVVVPSLCGRAYENKHAHVTAAVAPTAAAASEHSCVDVSATRRDSCCQTHHRKGEVDLSHLFVRDEFEEMMTLICQISDDQNQ